MKNLPQLFITAFIFISGFVLQAERSTNVILVKDGNRDGLWTSWYENGQKLFEKSYKDGKLDGLWTKWNENGHKELEENYKDGKRLGVYKKWDENGTLIRTGRYIDIPPPIPTNRLPPPPVRK